METPGAFSLLMSVSRALLAAVWRTCAEGAFLTGAGRALKAALLAASASSCRRSRSSFWALSFAAVASLESWKVGFVGAFVDFGSGGMDIGWRVVVGGSSPSASRLSRSSFCALSFAAMASPGSLKSDLVGGFVDFGGGGRLIGRGLVGLPSASRLRRSSFWALSFAAMASPGSWKVDWVGAFLDFGGAGGAGKVMLMGRRLEAR